MWALCRFNLGSSRVQVSFGFVHELEKNGAGDLCVDGACSMFQSSSMIANTIG